MNLKFSIVLVLALVSQLFSQEFKLSTKKKKDYLVTISTSLGEIQLILFDETPLHKANFLGLTQKGFYNGTTFHRVIKDFMVQGGDPNSKDDDTNNDGIGGPGYTVPAEFNAKFTHIQGAVAAARMGDQMNPKKESSGSQFYLVENAQGTHFLDNNYTVYGQVVKGIDILTKIASQPRDQRDRPNTDIKMTVSFKLMKKKKITKLTGWKYEE